MNRNTETRNNVTYHRYCGNCGWGFTHRQWSCAAFCTKCGVDLRHRTSTSLKQRKQIECFGCGRMFTAGEWRSTAICPDCGKSFHRRRKPTPAGHTRTTRVCTPEVQPFYRCSSGLASRLQEKAKGAIQAADRHPFLSATGTGLAGAGMIVGGQAISALGAGAATVGGVIAGMNMLGMFVASGTGARGLAALQFKGVGVGLGLMVAGTGVSLAGQAISIGGYVATGGAGLLAGYGVVKAAWNQNPTSARRACAATLIQHVGHEGSEAIVRRV